MAELRAWNPGWMDRAKYALSGLLGDDRQAVRDAEKIMGILEYTPGVGDAMAAGEARDAFAGGDYLGGGLLAAGAMAGLVPGVGDAVQKVARRAADEVGSAASTRVPERLREAYNARASQMELKPKDRVQPDPNRERFIDADYQTPSPVEFQDLAARYPRNPDPTAPLPKNNRAGVLVERRSDIARKLTEKILQSGQMGKDTRYFYHSDGPLYRAARKAGLSDAEAQTYVKDFADNFAATSPRTDVEMNTRNATSVMAKQAAGIPHRQIVGPGSGGISEAGYPMMTGKGGIHGILVDEVQSGRGINPATNTKPATFGGNMAGNRSGATVDTHAIRGVLQSLNELEPGSVPAEFIYPKFREKYAKDPSVLTPNMIDDTLASQMVGPKGATTKAQTEYPVFADIFHEVADNLGVSPAEAQSMAWFGLGGDTNLASAPKTVADMFDERLSVTAQVLGIPVEEAARRVFRREIPLLSVGGLLGAGALYNAEQDGQAPLL
jgi:hypothetical protein